jgi:hypothetical protein
LVCRSERVKGSGHGSVRHYGLLTNATPNARCLAGRRRYGVYLLSGTTGLRRGAIERLVRDAHGGTQHVMSSPGMWQAAGREVAGLSRGKHWVLLDLVDD